jgi:hypothetical protein
MKGMGTDSNIVELVEKFVILAKRMLKEGKIDMETYNKMVYNKVRFLNTFDKDYAEICKNK